MGLSGLLEELNLDVPEQSPPEREDDLTTVHLIFRAERFFGPTSLGEWSTVDPGLKGDFPLRPQ